MSRSVSSCHISNDCFFVESYELRDPNDNPISSLASVTLDLDGVPTVAVDLQGRKTATTNIFYVDEAAPANGDGLSWATAYQNIAEAFVEIDELLGSNEAATINVASGTYTWGRQDNRIGFDLNIIGQGPGLTNVVYDPTVSAPESSSLNKIYTAQFRTGTTYIEGMTFDGNDPNSSNAAVIVMDVRNADALTIVNSEFKNASAGGDGLNVFNTDTVVVYDSTAHHNDGDGFSYSNPNGTPMEVLEVDVNGSDNGLNGLWNSQGSTIHESVDIVRVGGVFERNPTNISDVSSGTSWNIDVTTADALANEQAGQYLNFNVSGGGTAWIIGGSHGQGINNPTVVNAQPGAQLRAVSKFGTLDPVTTLVTGTFVEDNQVLNPISVACVAAVSVDRISQDTGDPTDFVTYDQQIVISGSFVGVDLSVEFNGTTYAVADPELSVEGGSRWSLDLTSTVLEHGTYSVTATAIDGTSTMATDTRSISIDCTTSHYALVAVPVLTALDASVSVDSLGFGTVDIDLEQRKPSSSNTLYVDSNINLPAPTGSANSPFSDLPDAFDYIRLHGLSDATIYVAEGDYTWGDAINPATESSLFKASLTIIGSGPELTQVHQGVHDKAAGLFSEGGESLYVEGMSFIGLGDTGVMNYNEHAFEATGGVDLTFVDTVFTNAYDGDGLFVGNFDTVVVYDSQAIRNSADGFSYVKSSDGNAPMYVLEVGVIAAGNGKNGETSSQGSTNHRDSEIVRVNGTYANNPTNIEDTGLTSWNVNLDVKNATVFQGAAGDHVNFRVRGDKHEVTNGTAWFISGDYHEGGVIYASETTANDHQNTPVLGKIRYANTFDIGVHPVGVVLSEQILGQITQPADDQHLGVTLHVPVFNLNNGVAVQDNATGVGFIMYSSARVQDRFGVFGSNSDHFVAVQNVSGQWFYNNNSLWSLFSPHSTDHLVASVDFSADLVESLIGVEGAFEGIAMGFRSGNLAFVADQWGGQPNNGEFGVTGSSFTIVVSVGSVLVGEVRNGIAVQDNATGTGYLMYSEASVQDRFSLFGSNSEHFVAVRHEGGQWYYNNNKFWNPFSPVVTDQLLAAVDFSADTVTSLENEFGQANGIKSGFTSGDLIFQADQWGGQTNNGEFTILGTYFNVLNPTAPIPVGSLNKGIAVQDNAKGAGFIMFSWKRVQDRFGLFNSNDDHFVAVRHQAGTWYYNNNSSWITFTPDDSDRLLASVDFSSDIAVSLEGVEGIVQGIRQGYHEGDLVFIPNQWDGQANNGEFAVSGSYFSLFDSCQTL